MSDRVTTFLKTTHCSDWVRKPLAGDASVRRYVRLVSGSGETAVLMDAGPDASAEMNRFTLIAGALSDAGLAAPHVYKMNDTIGLMLLEDLGSNDIAKTVQDTPDQMQSCYDVATDVLLEIPKVAPLPLAKMTAHNAASWLAPLADWYGDTPIDIGPIHGELIDAFDDLGMTPDTLALRDYHAENLMWRPQENGLSKVGLLDFQDALYAPAGYDLASLTRDARRDVDPALAERLTQRFAQVSGHTFTDFSAQVACLAVQRNLRILGIFASLTKRDHKPQYAALAPRVWTYLERDSAHPALASLRRAVLSLVPAPTPNFLSRWTI